MLKEWQTEESPEFINICKLAMIKRVIFAERESNVSFVRKVIRGMLMPTICIRAMDVIIRREEEELLPISWMLGMHFECDREIATHRQTMFTLLRKWVDAWGLGKFSKFKTVKSEDQLIIPVRRIHSSTRVGG